MGKTTNLGLHTTATNETSKTFLEYRTELSGTGSNSNMNIIDKAYGNMNAKIDANQQTETAKFSKLDGNISEIRTSLSQEVSDRTSGDQLLQARIDNIIAPSGEAPSAAEVQDARLGAGGIQYATLGDAIREQVGGLHNNTNLLEKAGSILANNYWNKSGWHTSNSAFDSYDLIPVIAGKRIYVTGMSEDHFKDSVGGGFYESDKNTYLGGCIVANNGYIDIPTNAAYLNISYKKDSNMVLLYDDDKQKFDNFKKWHTVYDIRDNIYDYFLNSKGELERNTEYAASGFIFVEPNTYYKINRGTLYPTSRCGWFYDENKEPIRFFPTGAGARKPYTILTPNNASYLRFSFHIADLADQDINYLTSPADPLLFNPNTILRGRAINGDGTIITEGVGSYYVSDYIPVIPDSRYLISSPTAEPMWRANAVYDENYELIGTLPSAHGKRDGMPYKMPYLLTTNQSARYIRITGRLDDLSNQSIRYLGPNPDVEKYSGILEQMNRPTYVANKPQIDPLVLLWFTDLHNDFNSILYISEFYKRFSIYIDDVLSTGDIVETGPQINNHFYGGYTIFDNILQGVGNHELFDEDYNTPYTSKQVYDMQYKDRIANWGVTQPAAAATIGLNYWCKDYVAQNVRLIMLDCMFWTDAQLNWFVDVLADAKEKSLHVVCGTHFKPGFIDVFDTTHSTIQPINPTYPNGYGEAKLNDAACQAVQDFIDDGGQFVCWLSGHTHYDVMGVVHDYPQQISITLATAMSRVDQWNDTARAEIANQQTFDLLGIDTFRKVIKIARVGCQYDIYLRHKDTVAIDYDNLSLF